MSCSPQAFICSSELGSRAGWSKERICDLEAKAMRDQDLADICKSCLVEFSLCSQTVHCRQIVSINFNLDPRVFSTSKMSAVFVD